MITPKTVSKNLSNSSLNYYFNEAVKADRKEPFKSKFIKSKFIKCEKCGHHFNPQGQSGINHKVYCK